MKYSIFNSEFKARILIIVVLAVSFLFGAIASILAGGDVHSLNNSLASYDGVPELFLSAILESKTEFLIIVALLLISYTSIQKSLSCALLFIEGYNSAEVLNRFSDVTNPAYYLLLLSSRLLISAVCVLLCAALIIKKERSHSNSNSNEITILCSLDSAQRVYMSLLAGGSIILIRLIEDALISLIS